MRCLAWILLVICGGLCQSNLAKSSESPPDSPYTLSSSMDSSKNKQIDYFSDLNEEELFKRTRADKQEFVGPRCTPLLSKNLNANPYHPSLLSIPGAQVRKGFGRVVSIKDVSPLHCPANHPEDCTLSIGTSHSISTSSSISVSIGSTFSSSISEGASVNEAASNSIGKSIGGSIDRSISTQLSVSEEQGIAQQIGNTISKNHEKSSGVSRTESQETSETTTLSQELTSSNTLSTELSTGATSTQENSQSSTRGGSQSDTSGWNAGVTVDAEFKFFGMGSKVSVTAGVHGSQTSEQNWQNNLASSIGSTQSNTKSEGESNTSSKSNGKSNSKTAGHSSSSTNDNRISDSISVSKEVSQSNTQSKSKQKSNSDTIGSSYRIDENLAFNNETSFGKTNTTESGLTNTTSNETSTSITHTVTISSDTSFKVARGECKIAVCKMRVVSMAVPYQCIDESGMISIEHVEIMIDPWYINNQSMQANPCTQSIINCEDIGKPIQFSVLDSELSKPDPSAELHHGLELTSELADPLLVSANRRSSLFFQKNGNLVVKTDKRVVWSNGMGHFDNTYPMRLRITEKGHLVQEVMGLFDETSATEYRFDEWICVWSSAPVNHNVTIGIASFDQKVYRLILTNSGELKLYDAVDTLIWCTGKSCKHSKGYQFPEVYLVPTDIETPRIESDRHNNIEDVYFSKAVYKNDSIMSLDVSCSSYLISPSSGEQHNLALGTANGLISSDGRFRLILENSGNLVIKDHYRTMWESSSGHLPHAIGPYKLVISPSGNILIVSSNGFIVWRSFITMDDSNELQTDYKQPQGDGEQYQDDGEEPQGDGEQYQDDDEEPQGDGEEPQGDGEEPQGDGEEPQGDGEEPQGDGEEPQGDGEEPQGDGEEPQGDGEQYQDDDEQLQNKTKNREGVQNKRNPTPWPFKLTLLDEGRLVLTNSDSKEIWESWPMRNMSLGVTLFKPVEYRFEKCDGKPLLIRTIMNTTTLPNVTILDKLSTSEKLISEKNSYDLSIMDARYVVIRKLNRVVDTLFSSDKSNIDYLMLEKDGSLSARNQQNSTIWSTRNKNSKGTEATDQGCHRAFQLKMGNNGDLQVLPISLNESSHSCSLPLDRSLPATAFAHKLIKSKIVDREQVLPKKIDKNDKTSIEKCTTPISWTQGWSPMTCHRVNVSANVSILQAENTRELAKVFKANSNNANESDHLKCVTVSRKGGSCVDSQDLTGTDFVQVKGVQLSNHHEITNLDAQECRRLCNRRRYCSGISSLPYYSCYLVGGNFSALENNKSSSFIKKSSVTRCILSEWTEWSPCMPRFEAYEKMDFELLDEEDGQEQEADRIRLRSRRILLTPKDSKPCLGVHTLEEMTCVE